LDRLLDDRPRLWTIIWSATGLAVLIAFRAIWWGDLQASGQPLLALATFVLLAELAALGGMLVVRRSVKLTTLEAHRESAGFVYSTLGAAYAVLLSFLVVISWNRFHDDQQTITSEAIATSTLFHLADGLDTATRQELQQTLLAYTRVVLDHEWAAMARGEDSDEAWRLSDHLWDVYSQAPADDQGRPAYMESLRQMQEFYRLRGQRLLESRSTLPSAIWVVLMAGAMITVGFTYLFGVRSLLAQAVITIALTAIIAGSLYLVIDLDTPYSGPLQVSPAPYQGNEAFFTDRLQQ